MLRWLNEAATVRVEPVGAGAPDWRAALPGVQAALAAAAARAPGVRFVVSGHFVRYLALPWDAGISGARESEAFLRHQFDAVYGARAADWALACDGEGQVRVGAAIDRALVDELSTAASQARLSLLGIEPLGVAAFNRLRHKFDAGDRAFVVLEPGRQTLLVARDGAIAHAAGRRGDGDAALAMMLAGEALDAGITGQPGLELHCVAWPAADAEPSVLRSAKLAQWLPGSEAVAA